jgi:hypothetical protein
MGFIRFIGEQVHSDLLEGAFLHSIREQRPDLFPAGCPAEIEDGTRRTGGLFPVEISRQSASVTVGRSEDT